MRGATKTHSPAHAGELARSSVKRRAVKVSVWPTTQVLPVFRCACGGGCPKCQAQRVLQPKLRNDAPNDSYEQKADRIAEPVMRMPEPQVQRQRPEEDVEVMQGKFISSETPVQLQGDVSDLTNRNGIPGRLRAGLETLSRMELSSIRVHNNSSKPAQLNALAYTHGQDIHLGPGQEKHLPHEGWHAVQQMQGRVQATIQAKDVAINDDARLEREADVMGARALQRTSVGGGGGHEAAAASHPSPTQTAHGMRSVIQRAVKFEYQIKGDSFTNRFYRDDGTNVQLLPRKYGPEDYLVKGDSGVTLESETHGQPEFETGWTRNWFKLRAQIAEAYEMTKQMNVASPVIRNGVTYKKFPFSEPQIKHLRPGQGFRMRDGRWHKEQKARKVRVATERLNVRSGPGTSNREIAQLSRGEDVEVLETRGRWSRIEKGDIAGWVYNPLLRRWKRYESNEDDSGARTDTPLQPDEQLLVRVTDTNWKAYVQPSESFTLDQFESFLKQFEDSADVDPVVKDVYRTMSVHNPDNPPPANLLPDDSIADRLIKIAAAVAKVSSDLAFQSRSSGLKNLLLMVIYYIKMGQKRTAAEASKPAKFAFHLMSRTNFGSIFKSLREDEQELFKKMVEDPVNGIAASLGLAPGTPVLNEGHGGSAQIPTVQAWLIGITEGKDLLSGPGFSAAMGRFRIEEEFGRQKGLVRFESRRSEHLQIASKWVEHAGNLFMIAMRERPREAGKGKTGLKVGWKDLLKSLGF